ncbi:MAG: four-carbon acid sugar kinase family protein, partial [Candidatus Eremiobacteraeota bacterium]|nr:four-carbon acid sugar kinase family protein [Candidatus Eremiobacteraeota bacterium]
MIAFYGDDFTGSTDALAQYFRWGLRGRLYLSVPNADEIAASRDDVIGVAGVARSLQTAAMDDEIVPFLRSSLREARVLQYKVCSTFDSSAAVGSIGHVVRLARREGFRGPFPVLPAQPHFGRFTLFSNHFATYGDGIERLDRHPTMANHPSTPMDEADLRRVLAAQGVQGVAAFDITRIRANDAAARLRALVATEP